MPPIADLTHAILHEVAVNEIAFDQKGNPDGTPTLDDPIKLRFGAFIPEGRTKYYIGCIGFDVLRMKDGKVHRTEVGFLKFAVDETRDGDGHPMPMIEAFLTRGTDDSTDAAEERVLTVSRDACISHVPFSAPNLGGSSRPDCMWSPNGLYVTQQQDDGNFVTYRCTVPFDKFSGAVPVWSAWSGFIG